ncbi:hypothetical protein LguiB_005856 [Lonicera macranthoides]
MNEVLSGVYANRLCAVFGFLIYEGLLTLIWWAIVFNWLVLMKASEGLSKTLLAANYKENNQVEMKKCKNIREALE